MYFFLKIFNRKKTSRIQLYQSIQAEKEKQDNLSWWQDADSLVLQLIFQQSLYYSWISLLQLVAIVHVWFSSTAEQVKFCQIVYLFMSVQLLI